MNSPAIFMSLSVSGPFSISQNIFLISKIYFFIFMNASFTLSRAHDLNIFANILTFSPYDIVSTLTRSLPGLTRNLTNAVSSLGISRAPVPPPFTCTPTPLPSHVLQPSPPPPPPNRYSNPPRHALF